MYLRAYRLLYEFPPVRNRMYLPTHGIIFCLLFIQVSNLSEESRYSDLLQQLLLDHRNVITDLASALKECRQYMKVCFVRTLFPWSICHIDRYR